MSVLKSLLDMLPFNNNKTALGGALVTVGIAFGIFSAEDAEAIQATFPTIMAGIGAVVQLVGIIHKLVKKLRG